MPGEGAHILYLSILGVAILSSALFRYRGRMGDMLRTALIWVLIFFAMIAIYNLTDGI